MIYKGGSNGQKIEFKIPDKLYQQLAVFAQQQGKSAQDLGAQWLAADIERFSNNPLLQLAGTFDSGATNGIEPLEDVQNDPLWQACGLLNSRTPDLSERHDEYLKQSYTETQDHE